MDPNLFALDWAQLGEGLAALVVLSFLVERSLAVFLENSHIANYINGRGIKELPAIGLSVLICYTFDFDILAIMLHQEKVSDFGLVITGAVISGGSKASIKLFHDVMGMKPKRPEEGKGS